MSTPNGSNKGLTRERIVLAALSALTLTAVGTTTYLWTAEREQHDAADRGRLYGERLLGEKLKLEKRVVDMTGQLADAHAGRQEAETRLAELERRVNEARQREQALVAQARRTDAAERRAREAKEAHEQLFSQLNMARSEARDLQAQLDALQGERDALAQRLNEQQQGAWMVNNAVVEAVRGRKSLLTVKARRTREIRMAFDLPQRLAPNANFRIVTPEGLSFAGNDPALSMTVDAHESEALAAVDLTPGLLPEERAARVHLTFAPEQKLKPGTYRIDVRSGDQYLNTVLLRLR